MILLSLREILRGFIFMAILDRDVLALVEEIRARYPYIKDGLRRLGITGPEQILKATFTLDGRDEDRFMALIKLLEVADDLPKYASQYGLYTGVFKLAGAKILGSNWLNVTKNWGKQFDIEKTLNVFRAAGYKNPGQLRDFLTGAKKIPTPKAKVLTNIYEKGLKKLPIEKRPTVHVKDLFKL